MKRIAFLLLAVVTLGGIAAYIAHASGQSDGFIGLVSRRKTTTKSWPVHSPALNLLLSAPP